MKKYTVVIVILTAIAFLVYFTSKNKINNQNEVNKPAMVSDTTLVNNATPLSLNQMLSDTQSNESINNLEDIEVAGIKPQNSSNSGFIAADGDFVYFWSGTSYEIEDGKFCKMKNDGTEFSILSNDMPCSINIIDEKIYYISKKSRDNNHGAVYCIDKNGDERTLLVDKDCSNLMVTDKYLYFVNQSDGSKIYRANKSGSNLQVIVSKKVNNLQYDNGFLYFETDDNELFRVATYSRSKPIKLISNFYSYIVHGENIYFLRDWFPYVYSMKSKKESLLYKDRIYGMTIKDNMFYWLGGFDISDEGRGAFAYDLAAVSLDGQNIKIINRYSQNQGKIAPIYYFDNYIYYGVDRNEGANFELARVKSDGTGEEYLGEYLLK